MDCERYRFHNYRALTSRCEWVRGTFIEKCDPDSFKWAMPKDETDANKSGRRAFHDGYDFSNDTNFSSVVSKLMGPERLRPYYTERDLVKLQMELNMKFRRRNNDNIDKIEEAEICKYKKNNF